MRSDAMITFAIASTDGERIDAHFARAEQFYIYTVDEDGVITQTERRDTASLGGLAGHDGVDARAELLAGADYVLCAKIGPPAVRALSERGVRAYALPGDINRALQNFVRRRGMLEKMSLSESALLASCAGCGSGGGCSSSGCD
jgi:predicted Fe-Mo cluster-binding NifX family protein